MRGMIIAVAISFFLALGMGIYCGESSRQVSEEFIVRIEEVAAAIQMEQWESALQLIRAAEKAWENQSKTLAMWVNHGDVDEVSVGLTQLRISLQEKEKYHALLYAAELNEALALIYHRDALALKNIL